MIEASRAGTRELALKSRGAEERRELSFLSTDPRFCVYFSRYPPNGKLARILKVSLRISPGIVDFIHGLTSTRFIFAINQNQLNYLRKTGASLLALAETIYYQ